MSNSTDSLNDSEEFDSVKAMDIFEDRQEFLFLVKNHPNPDTEDCNKKLLRIKELALSLFNHGESWDIEAIEESGFFRIDTFAAAIPVGKVWPIDNSISRDGLMPFNIMQLVDISSDNWAFMALKTDLRLPNLVTKSLTDRPINKIIEFATWIYMFNHSDEFRAISTDLITSQVEQLAIDLFDSHEFAVINLLGSSKCKANITKLAYRFSRQHVGRIRTTKAHHHKTLIGGELSMYNKIIRSFYDAEKEYEILRIAMPRYAEITSTGEDKLLLPEDVNIMNQQILLFNRLSREK